MRTADRRAAAASKRLRRRRHPRTFESIHRPALLLRDSIIIASPFRPFRPLRARSPVAGAGVRAGVRRALATLPCAMALACTRGDDAAHADGALAALAAARVPRPFAARLSIETRYRPCSAAPSAPGSTVPAEGCGPAAGPSERVLAAAE